MENNKIPDILTQVSREKFRRRVMIGSRVIAVALILAIFWIGYIQMSYAKEFNDMKSEHGANAFCYYCGIESGKTCSCNYLRPGQSSKEIKAWLEDIAYGNAQKCENIHVNGEIEDINLEIVN